MKSVETDRAAANRKIAEWFEPMPSQLGHKRMAVYSPLSAWINTFDAGWEARDFYGDEAANAMVLDRLRDSDDDVPSREFQKLLDCLRFSRMDRKQLVCDSAMAVIELSLKDDRRSEAD